MEFSLAAIVTLVKEALYEPISDEDLINLLIADMVSKLNLKSKTGDSYYMDKRLVSKIMTNKRNVPVVLRKSLSKEAASVDSMEKYFAKTLMPKLIPEKLDSLCRETIVSYSDYEEFSDIALLEVKKCFDKKQLTRVLAYIFRLSLLVPNKIDRLIDKKKPATGIDRRYPIKDIKLTDDISIPCLRAVLEAYISTDNNIEGMNIEDYKCIRD